MAVCGPEDSVYQCNEKWKRALRRREAEAMRPLIDAYRQAYKQLQGELEALLQEVAAQHGEATKWQLMQERRYRALMAQVEGELARLEAVTADITTQAQADALGMATDAVTEQLAAAGVTVNFAGFPMEAYAALVGVMEDGTPLAEHLAKTLRPEALKRLRQSLLSGLAAGWNPRKVARMAAQEAMGLALGQAMTIARTEMLRAYRMGTLQRYRESEVVEGWIWSAAKDRRVCAACLALDCKEFPLSQEMETHPNCRCTMLPKIAGVQYRKTCGGDWLGTQPPAVQDEILGKAGGLAFRAGAVRLDDFVGRKRSARWGAMHYRRSLAEILGKDAEVWKQASRGKRAQWLQRLLSGKERVVIGFVQQDIARLWGRNETTVLLSAERRAHYLKRHPEIADYEGVLQRLIKSPDEVHKNKEDAGVAIFYMKVGKRYLRSVVAMRPHGGDDLQPFIISVRLARQDEVIKSAEAKRKVWP